MYIGGKEHSVLHLLYSRFVTMVMHDLGYAPEEEPFKKFRAHGLLIRESAKMSKSKGNVINPDEYIEKFGADAVRLYLMFLGDMRQGGDWQDKGMAGVAKFVPKVYNLFDKIKQEKSGPELVRLLHQTVKGVAEDLENLKYNTAIAKLMILSNKIQEVGCTAEEFGWFLILLAPFMPHLAEELWEKLGNKESIFKASWPKYDSKLVKEEEITLVVQINGKVRENLVVAADISEAEAKKLVLASEKVQKWLEGKEPKKMVFVPGKLISIVI
jgi:leucyl-tRNA synthetase